MTPKQGTRFLLLFYLLVFLAACTAGEVNRRQQLDRLQLKDRIALNQLINHLSR